MKPKVICHIMGSAESPMMGQSLKLVSVEQKTGGIVWLRHKILKD